MGADRLVYVIAKAPGLGTAKTRLTPPLPASQAVVLARAFLLDSVEIVQGAGIGVRLLSKVPGKVTET